MKRLIATFAIAALVLPATALGKGPTAATIDGPGAGGGITFSGSEGSGPLGNLIMQSGWFEAAFAQAPSPMLPARPKGDLGPKYTVTYTVPGGENDTLTIRQDIYPYASSGPVTYMAPGQPLYDLGTRGGWFQGGPDLKETLVAAGLPATATAAAAAGSAGSSDDSSFPTVAVSLIALAVLFAGATALLIRRRERPAPAA